jgi:hypothetical protein
MKEHEKKEVLLANKRLTEETRMLLPIVHPVADLGARELAT